MPRFSIKTKLSGMITLLVLSFVAFIVLYNPRRVHSLVQRTSEVHGRQMAETVANAIARPLGQGNMDEVTFQLRGVRTIPSFRFSAVFDDTGRLRESTPNMPAWAVDFAKAGAVSQAQTRGEMGMLVATAPVYYQERDTYRSGTLVLGFSTDEQRLAAKEDIRLGLWIGGLALVLGIAASIFIANAYINPIIQLTEAAHQVAQGHFEGLAVRVRSRDELEELSRSFEVMTNKLRISRDEIERQNRLLEFRVQERTRQLMETIWELEEIRANLEHLVQERTRGLEQSQLELRAWASTLEEKVQEKTLELTELNQSLLASFEQLQAVDRMKDEFLANMSHELRTPLNAVIGFSGLLLQEDPDRLPPDVREDLSIILENGRSLLAMIDSILDLSKIEAGRFDLELEPIQPIHLLREVKPLALALILDRPLQFHCELPDWEVQVMGDPVRFKQILNNIIGNAIKFTERGSVRIQVTRDAEKLRVAVQDTGIGMSGEEIERLFRPFQQVDGSITRRFGGTGLGLALAKRLVELMRGEIQVDSQKGIGSTFTLVLPIMKEG